MTLQDLMADPIIGDLRTPKLSVGEIATDFALRPLGWVQETVRLSQFEGERPVALVFGSYSAPRLGHTWLPSTSPESPPRSCCRAAIGW
jgi:hypothetical protein